jgi:hypothetical protein
MPAELECAERLDGMISSRKTAQDRIRDLLDPEYTTEEDDIDDDDDDYDEELEFAYQCDFQKKRPNKPCSKTSLLSNLLSTSAGAATATTTKQCDNILRPKPINLQKSLSVPIPTAAYSSPTKATSDPLSESLKRNLEWEHCQSLLKKYQQNRKASHHDFFWTDNFSKW